MTNDLDVKGKAFLVALDDSIILWAQILLQGLFNEDWAQYSSLIEDILC